MNYNSQSDLYTFHPSDESWRAKNNRDGEIKLSQTIQFGPNVSKCKYIILGISEDIGPQMNNGLPGSTNGYQSVISTLQNVQSNRYLKGTEIGVLGEISQNKVFLSKENSKGWVEELDIFVGEVLAEYVAENQQLIVIGGGHNNAYPILQHHSKKSSYSIHGINIDPHADCRNTEFRHSGNPFSFALDKGFLQKYSIIGLHESYNNEYIYSFLEKTNSEFCSFEQYLNQEEALWDFIHELLTTKGQYDKYTLDIDLDAIAFVPTSAYSPSGFSIEEIRRMIVKLCGELPFNSLHLPEGAPKTELDQKKYAKMLVYFILDFVKAQNRRSK